jgi:hypothetical protein
VVELPLHTLSVPEIVAVMLPATVTVTVVVSVHPAPLVPITVYVVVTAGLAVGLGQFVHVKPPEADQV